MAKPPQLASVDVEEQWLYFELLPGDRAPCFISKEMPLERKTCQPLVCRTLSFQVWPKAHDQGLWWEQRLTRKWRALLFGSATSLQQDNWTTALLQPLHLSTCQSHASSISLPMNSFTWGSRGHTTFLQLKHNGPSTRLLFLLNPKFDYRLKSPFQYTGVGSREAESCDLPVVGAHPPIPFLEKMNHHPVCQSRGPVWLLWRIAQDKSTISRVLRHSGKASSNTTAEYWPLRCQMVFQKFLAAK